VLTPGDSNLHHETRAQVTHLLGKPLLRVFGPMRRIVQMEPGWGLNIVSPPVPRSPQVQNSAPAC